MISRISFIKLVKTDLKRRSWLVAFISALLFIVLPVACLMGINQNLHYTNENALEQQRIISNWFKTYLSIDNGITIFLVIIFAIICGITAFQYLHSRMKLDLYHSIPVRRDALFLAQYVGGFLIFALPYIINILLCILIGSIRGVMLVSHAGTIIGTLCINLIFYLLIYSVTILAMMLTGKIIVAILGSLVFFFYGPLVHYLLIVLKWIYFSTYMSGDMSRIWLVNTKLSPLTLYLDVRNKWLGTGGFPWIYCVVTVLIIILLGLLNIFIYKQRDSERAEHAMAFSHLQPIIKILLVVPLSLGCGIITKAISGSNNDGWTIFGIVFGALLINAIIEFIYHVDIREIIKRKISLGLGALLPLLVLAFYHFDLTGYDSYLPKENSINSMSIYSDQVNAYYNYPTQSGLTTISSVLDHTQVEDFSAIYELAKEGISYTEDFYNNSHTNNPINDDIDMKSISVSYQLKSGKHIYRSYFVPRDKYDNCIETLYDSTDFNRKIIPINYIDQPAIINIRVYDLIDDETNLRLTPDEIRELIDIYIEEVSQLSYKDTLDGKRVSTLAFEIGQSNEYSYFYSSIYESCTKTINFLQEHGFSGKLGLTAEEVKYIEVTIYNYSRDTNNPETYKFTDEQSVTEILENISCHNNYAPYDNSLSYGDYLELSIAVYLDTDYDEWINASLTGEKLPKCIEDIFE